ncbi:APC family permease [Candidatus Saganbacteria bacterium]|uniref:APC family permease n=1 Tax=Candidatus Saganbacteria bacterium TaxID=2575572 RepID=A0A9D6YSS8_UNCSA|nr:APC family permease [Candidatus Saganbacteria bacterium]
METGPDPGNHSNLPEDASLLTRLRHFFIGPPRDLEDHSLYRRITLIPLLAWIGLGADGLSSSAYGPEEGFRALGSHSYLAIGLAVMTAMTVLIIAYAYSRVIEHFPYGGGGYVVATKLLGSKAGLISGSALIVDYVLTITISIAASGDAIFSLLSPEWMWLKLSLEVVVILFLTMLNLRGMKESVLILTPIFIVFIFTHIILIVGGVLIKAPALPDTLNTANQGFSSGLAVLGIGGMAALFLHAYSLGGGTYTGIEAVSNGLAIMRAPHVQTGKRTMLYMAVSLAFTASGLLLCYLLWNIAPVEGKTMNATLAEKFAAGVPFGYVFVMLTVISEGALLVVAAQSGFADGPRVMANMATDSWLPRRFAALSDRLATQNGILLMGMVSLAALLFTHGNVGLIVVMYSINVFLTFSMTEVSMCRFWIHERFNEPNWTRKISIHVIGLAMCLMILTITVYEKFLEGGWVTLLITLTLVSVCMLIKSHYNKVAAKLTKLYSQLMDMPKLTDRPGKPLDPSQHIASILVSGYGGLGLHTLLGIFREFPNHFNGVVFLSVGVIDSREFKGESMVELLKDNVEDNLLKYVNFANGQGISATYRMAIGTDAVKEAEKLCIEVSREFPHVTFFAGKILFEKEKWYQRVLHNETAFAIQKRLQWAGKTMVIIPARVI